MDYDQFLRRAIEVARETLPFTGGDVERAATCAIDEAHVALPQSKFWASVDAHGGIAALKARIAEALREDR